MRYFGYFIDAAGNSITTEQHAADDNGAKLLFNGIASKSDAGWKALSKEEDVAVDAGVFTNYQDAAKPAGTCNRRSKGVLTYAVQSTRQRLRVSIPAVDPAYLSPSIPTVSVDPCLGPTNLIDEEGVAVTEFLGGKYDWTPSKNP